MLYRTRVLSNKAIWKNRGFDNARRKRKNGTTGKKEQIKILILPRIGITEETDSASMKILAFQMMGIEKNGNTCPFLEIETGKKSPHGGYPCKIYEDRPLACKTYPLIEIDPITLDQKCKFCKEHKPQTGI